MATLYRHFNLKGELLYIGQSRSVVERACSHVTDKPWGHEIEMIKLQHGIPDDEINEIERDRIEIEKPKYNIIFNRIITEEKISEALSVWNEFRSRLSGVKL